MTGIGIDVGGTFVKFCAAGRDGRVIRKASIPTDTKLDAAAFLGGLSAVVNTWKKELKGKDFALGVGLPGDTDHIRGVLRWAPNIPWHNLKVRETLSKETGCQCFVSNDANMAAWGVHSKELKAKYKDLIIVTMGTGIGGGVIINGSLYQGATGSAGELGHMRIDFTPRAPVCGCGMRGCLEAFCGTKGIRAAALAAAKKYPGSELARLLKSGCFSVSLLSAAAQKGDGAALDLWRAIGARLADGIANMVMLLNPQAVVLTGGVSRGAEYFKQGMTEVFKKQSVKTPFEKLKILISKEGDIGAAGAALYALSKADES
jgi:glucokinase